MEICLLVQNIMPLQYYSITVFEKQKRWVRSVLPVKNHKKNYLMSLKKRF